MQAPTQPNLFSKLALTALLVIGICSQLGCQIFGRFSGATAKPIPVAYNGMPSQQQLLANLKSRSDRVHQLSTSVTAAIPGAPKTKGTLQIEFPNRVRMKADVLGVSRLSTSEATTGSSGFGPKSRSLANRSRHFTLPITKHSHAAPFVNPCRWSRDG